VLKRANLWLSTHRAFADIWCSIGLAGGVKGSVVKPDRGGALSAFISWQDTDTAQVGVEGGIGYGGEVWYLHLGPRGAYQNPSGAGRVSAVVLKRRSYRSLLPVSSVPVNSDASGTTAG
jgi:hypothetical protein